MQAVILAAGESSRFWPLNQKHKSLIKIMGKPLICYTIEGLKRGGVRDIIIVQGPKRDIEKELESNSCYLKKARQVKINYVIQHKPKGTGDALWQARNFIKGPFFLTGPHKVDLDDYFPKLLRKFKKNTNRLLLVGVKTSHPWDFGILKLKGNKIVKIVENPPKGRASSDIKATETYFFPKKFLDYYKKVPQREENLIDTINLFIKEGKADFVLLNKEPASLKYPWDIFKILHILFESKNFKNKIDSSVFIGKNVIIEKRVFIGTKTKVLDGAIIKGPAFIGSNCIIGNNAVIRDYTNIENEALIGSFSEIKNSILQEDFHSHSNYLGNSFFDKGCRVGVGTVTANRRLDRQNIEVKAKGEKIDTGHNYLGVVVGEDSKVGVNSSLMPGVLIGSHCFVGPHSLVMENIKDNTVFFTTFKNVKKRKK